MNKKWRFTGGLIGVIAILIAGISMLYPDVYRDNEFVINAWFGNDLITAFIAGPTLIFLSVRKNMQQNLQLSLFFGMVWYMFYNFFFYLFGAAFNPFFLIYIIIILLSARILIPGISTLLKNGSLDDVKKTGAIGRKAVGTFLIGFGSLIGLMWVTLSFVSIIQGKTPPQVDQTGGITAIIFAIDLLFLVPSTILAGRSLIKNQRGGQELAIMVLTKCVPYGGVLILMHWISLARGGDGDPFVLLWIVLTFMSISSWLYLAQKIRITHIGLDPYIKI